MRLTPEAPVDSIVDTTRTNLIAGLITTGEAIATVRDTKGCSEYGARVLLGIEFEQTAAEQTATEAYEETEDNWRSFLGPLYPKSNDEEIR